MHAPVRADATWPYAGAGEPVPRDGTPRPTELVAIPYAMWGNRSSGAMRVWMPVTD